MLVFLVALWGFLLEALGIMEFGALGFWTRFFFQGFWVYIPSLRDIGVSGEMAEPPELLHRAECS